MRPKTPKPSFATALFLGVVCILATTGHGESILTSPHNLSSTGPGPVRAASRNEVCVFCHTPHAARTVAPLWNRLDSTTSYIPYNSPSIKARPGQPTGSSKLCLSCHDGTIALGNVVSESAPIPMAGSDLMPPGRGLIGTDLRDDHPISFPYLDSLSGGAKNLAPISSWDQRVKLDPSGAVQCTTCHNPHDDQFGDFLVLSNRNSTLCLQCHTFTFFSQTPHALSGNTWNGVGTNPWPESGFTDVASNACLNCHRSHHAPGMNELVSSSIEEDVCFVCHNGNVSSFNLQSVFQKTFTHPVERFHGLHQDGETPEQARTHVECVDCHNPHRARPVAAQAPFVSGVLEGVSGVDANGNPIPESLYQYQICFKCHGEDGQLPLHRINRILPTFDLIRKFSPSSPSFHPVENAGINADVPSLISPLTPSSIIYCTDCHGNDTGQPGTLGPHGSNIEFLLLRQYATGDNVTESEANYALCYGCHSRTSLLSDNTFPHSFHLQTVKAPCSVCHDPHGIDSQGGNRTNNAHLINFDASVVQADPVSGKREYQSTGSRSGECFLRCHNVNHSPFSYP